MQTIRFNRGWHFAHEAELDAFNHFGMDKDTDAVGAPARWYDHDNKTELDGRLTVRAVLVNDTAETVKAAPRRSVWAGRRRFISTANCWAEIYEMAAFRWPRRGLTAFIAALPREKTS